ncbi:MAG: SpaA isopeptide-forming pilin-related protein, partial [Oscillospiraceae bacterium]
MKNKIKAVAVVFTVLLLCLQSVAFAAMNDSNVLTFTGTKSPGFPAIIEDGTHKPMNTLKLQDTINSREMVAYAVDTQCEPKPNHTYSTCNLEDGFFGAEVAKKVRTILNNSFPFATIAEIERRSGLTANNQVAVSAAQLAIWQLTNGKAYQPYVQPDNGDAARVNALKDWYLTLSGTAPVSVVSNIDVKHTIASDGTLDIAYKPTGKNTDGTDISLICSLNPSMPSTTKPIDAEGYCHTVVSNPPPTLSAIISGFQYLTKDAYLYYPQGGGASSQLLAGITDSAHRVQRTVPIECTPPVTGGSIKITKTDSCTTLPMSGVQFKISQQSNFTAPVYTITTNASGIAEKTGLAAGTWYIKEVSAPAGYMPITDVITVSVGANSVTELPIKNTPYSGIKILKVDQSNNPLAGGKFSIYAGGSATGTPLYSNLTTNASGIVIQNTLAPGEYTVLETEAPAGYVKAPNPITLTLLLGQTKEAKFVNTCIATSTIKILKVDPNNQPLAGGKFSIYSGSTTTGTPLYTNLTTNASGIVTQGGLAAGTYTVLETEAPAGYVKAPNPITLTLSVGETKEAKFVNTCVTTSAI